MYKCSYQFKDVTIPRPRNDNGSYIHFIESLYSIIFNFFYFVYIFTFCLFFYLSGSFMETYTTELLMFLFTSI